MAERDRKDQSATDHNQTRRGGEDADIIPGRHGKHGGSLESEGEPQDESREAEPPREADDTTPGR